jgi:hypothetical protein
MLTWAGNIAACVVFTSDHGVQSALFVMDAVREVGPAATTVRTLVL